MKIRNTLLVGITLLMTSATSLAQIDEAELPLEDLQAFAEVFGKIKNEYVDSVDDKTLLKDAIRGMLAGLDPHSTFLGPEDFEDIKISTEGKFGGLGIEVVPEEGLIKVVTPIDGTPAYDAGIQPGDLILKLDDVSVRGMDLQDSVDKMRGEPGSTIKLTILRKGASDPLEIELVRAIIKMVSVRGKLIEPGFGYVRLSGFQADTAHSLRRKVKKLVEENGSVLDGFVLDLRNNPGGVLSGAVDVSDLFLGDGDIVKTRGRTQSSEQIFSAKPDDITSDAPMVVLVNGGSASASEIVAGALQDHKRAIIIGTRTFGKGSVQTVIPVSNGGALKLTTARYYTPSDRSIQAKGIVPDIISELDKVASTKELDEYVSESDLSGHLENETTEQGEDSQDDENDVDLDSAENDWLKDSQLKEAINLLKAMSLVRNRSTTASN